MKNKTIVTALLVGTAGLEDRDLASRVLERFFELHGAKEGSPEESKALEAIMYQMRNGLSIPTSDDVRHVVLALLLALPHLADEIYRDFKSHLEIATASNRQVHVEGFVLAWMEAGHWLVDHGHGDDIKWEDFPTNLGDLLATLLGEYMMGPLGKVAIGRLSNASGPFVQLFDCPLMFKFLHTRQFAQKIFDGKQTDDNCALQIISELARKSFAKESLAERVRILADAKPEAK